MTHNLTDSDWQHILHTSPSTYTPPNTTTQYYIKQHNTADNPSHRPLQHEYKVLQHIQQQTQHHATHITYNTFHYHFSTDSLTEYLAVLYLYPAQSLAHATTPVTRQRCMDLVDAVHQLHQCDVLHNDIKPEHIYIADDHITLIDFDLATYVSQSYQSRMCNYFRGSALYAGIDTHLGMYTTVSSDYESLCYTLLQLTQQYSLPCLTGNHTEMSLDHMLQQLVDEAGGGHVHQAGDAKIRWLTASHTDTKLQLILSAYIVPIVLSSYKCKTPAEHEQYCYTTMLKLVDVMFDSKTVSPDVQLFSALIDVSKYSTVAIDRTECFTIADVNAWLAKKRASSVGTQQDAVLYGSAQLELFQKHSLVPLSDIAELTLPAAYHCTLLQYVRMTEPTRATACQRLCASMMQLELGIMTKLMPTGMHPYMLTRCNVSSITFIDINDTNSGTVLSDVVEQYRDSHDNLCMPRLRVLSAVGRVSVCALQRTDDSMLDMLLAAASMKQEL